MEPTPAKAPKRKRRSVTILINANALSVGDRLILTNGDAVVVRELIPMPDGFVGASISGGYLPVVYGSLDKVRVRA